MASDYTMCREEKNSAREAAERSQKSAKVRGVKASKAPAVEGGADVVPVGDVGGCASRGGAAAFGGGSSTTGCKKCIELGMEALMQKREVEFRVETAKLVEQQHALTLQVQVAEHKNEKNELEAKNAALERRQKELEAANERLVLEKREQEIPHAELEAQKQSLQSAHDALALQKKEQGELEAMRDRLEREKRVLVEEKKAQALELDNLWGVRLDLQRARGDVAAKENQHGTKCEELKTARQELERTSKDLQRARGEVAAREKQHGTKCEELKTARQELERTSKDLQSVKLMLEGENKQHAIKCKEFRAARQELQSVKLALEGEQRSHETKCEELKGARQDLRLVKMDLGGAKKSDDTQYEELRMAKQDLECMKLELGGAKKSHDTQCAVARKLTSENKELQAAVDSTQGLQRLMQELQNEKRELVRVNEELERDKQALMKWVGTPSGKVVVERAKSARVGESKVLQGADGELQRGEQGRKSRRGENTAPPAGIGSFRRVPGAVTFTLHEPGVGVPASQSAEAAPSRALCLDTGFVFQRGKRGKSTNGKLQSSCVR